MTYYYMNNGILTRRIRMGAPPTNEYVIVDSSGIARLIKNGLIVQQQKIEHLPTISKQELEEFSNLRNSYGDPIGIGKEVEFALVKKMLSHRRKKIKKPKVKRCKCK